MKMANGFLVVDKDDWEHATTEQRSWMTFNTLSSIDARLKKIEKRSFFDKACATTGGFLGGAAAFLGVKFLEIK